MRFFTPDLLERFKSSDPAIAGAADAEWETAHERYAEKMRQLEPTLPPHLREFNELLLHDASLQTLARDGNRLLMVLKKDVPPRDVVVLTYDLLDEPLLVPFEKQPREWQKPTRFDFDEFAQVQEGDRAVYLQSIVFANGWELRFRFQDVRITTAAPLAPTSDGGVIPVVPPAIAQPV